MNVQKALHIVKSLTQIVFFYPWFANKVRNKSLSFPEQKVLYGYQNPDLVGSIVERNVIFRREVRASKIPAEALSTIAGVGMAIQGANSLCVVDFGGGGGNHHAIAQKAFPDIQFNWTVIETREMVHLSKKKISEPGLTFIDDIKKFHGSPDLIFSNSAIQYSENPLEVYEALRNLKPKFIFLTRTPFSINNEVIKYTQKSQLSSNGPRVELDFPQEKIDVTYEVTIIPKTQMLEILSQEYEVTCTFAEGKWDITRFGDSVVNHGFFLTRKKVTSPRIEKL